jgi:hypothetical protein
MALTPPAVAVEAVAVTGGGWRGRSGGLALRGQRPDHPPLQWQSHDSVRLNGIDVWARCLRRGGDRWQVGNVTRRKVGGADIRSGHTEHPRFCRDDSSALDLIAADFSVLVESNPSALSRQRNPLHVGHALRFGFPVVLAHRGQLEPSFAEHCR